MKEQWEKDIAILRKKQTTLNSITDMKIRRKVYWKLDKAIIHLNAAILNLKKVEEDLVI